MIGGRKLYWSAIGGKKLELYWSAIGEQPATGGFGDLRSSLISSALSVPVHRLNDFILNVYVASTSSENEEV